MFEFFGQFAAGTWVTFQLAIFALAVGMLLGIVFALGKLSSHFFLRAPCQIITGLIRGLPEILVLFFIYYGGAALLTVLLGHTSQINAFVSGVIALSLLFGSYASETLRGAYLAIPAGQKQAALSYGFSNWQTFSKIILPQMWQHALPGLSNLWFILLKDTALVSLIGLSDIMQVALNAIGYTQQPFTYYLIAALIYLLLTSLSLAMRKYLQSRLHGCEPEEVNQ